MRAFLLSFRYAFKGFITAVKSERNLRFHLVLGCYAMWLGFMFRLQRMEFALLCLTVAFVISLELINSAIERSQDVKKTDYCERIGAIKDIAASAVLIGALGAIAVGVLLFFDIEKLIGLATILAENPLYILLFVVSIILSFIFVIKFKER